MASNVATRIEHQPHFASRAFLLLWPELKVTFGVIPHLGIGNATTRFHHRSCRIGGGVAARGTRSTASQSLAHRDGRDFSARTAHVAHF